MKGKDLIFLLFFCCSVGFVQAQDYEEVKNLNTFVDTDTAFVRPDVFPKFKGGDSGYLWYIARTIRFPMDQTGNMKPPKLVATFVIDTTGKITNIKFIVGAKEKSFTTQIVKTLTDCETWQPAIWNNKPVRAKCQQQFTFTNMGVINPK